MGSLSGVHNILPKYLAYMFIPLYSMSRLHIIRKGNNEGNTEVKNIVAPFMVDSIHILGNKTKKNYGAAA